MNKALRIVAVAAWLVPVAAVLAPRPAFAAADEVQTVAVLEPSSVAMQPPVGVMAAAPVGLPNTSVIGNEKPLQARQINQAAVANSYGGLGSLSSLSPFSELELASQRGEPRALVELATKYAHAEGVPRDQTKANQLYCRAAKYGSVDGLYNLGWAYANGRGVTRDDGAAAALFRKAAERGHEHAAKLLEVMPDHADAKLPDCAVPSVLPVAALPARPPGAADDWADAQLPMAPKEIMQLVNKLAPQFEVDANLALAVIYAESAFNPQAQSPANAQGLMQLIPETAERFGVKQPFKPDENIKGGLAYLRWLLAYFQGDVPLVLAAYNAGEGAVEKHRGIPPYNETRDYVKKITNMYRRLTHPYNSSIVSPSPVLSQLKRVM